MNEHKEVILEGLSNSIFFLEEKLAVYLKRDDISLAHKLKNVDIYNEMSAKINAAVEWVKSQGA